MEFLADSLEPLAKPVGRGLHLHSANYASREPPAQIRRFDINARRGGNFVGGLLQFWLDRFERQPINRGHFARDAVVAEAVGPIRGNLGVEHRTRRRIVDGVDRDSGEREPRAQLRRRRGDLHKFLQPVIENLHAPRLAVSMPIS